MSLASNDSDSACTSGLNDCIHQLLPGTGHLAINQDSFENTRINTMIIRIPLFVEDTLFLPCQN